MAGERTILVEGDPGEGKAGKWRRASRDQQACGASAVFSCPGCARPCSLTTHKIDQAGAVTPSVVCPFDGCPFHDYVELGGWRP